MLSKHVENTFKCVSNLCVIYRSSAVYTSQTAGNGHSGPAPASSSQAAVPALDPYSEKVQEKGRKELEELTKQPDPMEDEWVDVRLLLNAPDSC